MEELLFNLVVPVWLRLAERCSDSVEGLVVLLQLVALPAELPVEVYLKIPLGREIEMQPNTWSLNKRLIRVNPMGQRTHPKVKQTQKGGRRGYIMQANTSLRKDITLR